MNIQLMHDMTFYAMYACAALAVFVSIERLIFYVVTMKHARDLEAVMHHDIHDIGELPENLVNRDSIPVEVLRQML
ncbi:MAG: MotA/TolQ/ExbB proton channel family protein, partial [Burkholderiales bacterium]|nr:MotA/TolQ/ExbB proton channel family protein [Burkholderiales bacterium]